jgi:hypothetical protein
VRLRRITALETTDPAAGAQWSFTVPAGKVWRVVSLRAQLVTDATVANREVTLLVRDVAANVRGSFPATTVWPASQNATITWGAGLAAYAAPATSNTRVVGIPTPFWALSGWTLESFVTAMQAADNWTAAFLTVEEWR